MRKNLTRILILVAAISVFGLGATTALAQEVTVVTVVDPFPFGWLLDQANQQNNQTPVYEVTEAAVIPDLSVLIPTSQGPQLTADIADEGLASSAPSFEPGGIVELRPNPVAQTETGDAPAAYQQPEPAADQGAPETGEQATDTPAADTPPAAQNPILLTKGSGSDGLVVMLAIIGILAAVWLIAFGATRSAARP